MRSQKFSLATQTQREIIFTDLELRQYAPLSFYISFTILIYLAEYSSMHNSHIKTTSELSEKIF